MNFYWIGTTSVSGKLKPYCLQRYEFVAVFGSPGIYDINTWKLFFQPKMMYKFVDNSEIQITPDKKYTQTPVSSLLVTIKSKKNS